MTRKTLIIFVKEPVAGTVKTRLGHGIGLTAAAWWYRHQTSRLLRRLGRDPRWQTVLAIAPDTAIGSRTWPPGLIRIRQGSGDIGQRMARALGATGPGPVVLIGSDIPAISPADIAEAFGRLGGADVVFGPASDGGFWLVGVNRRPLPLGMFDGVRWSGEHALGDVLGNLARARVALVRTLDDVDTAEDLVASQIG